MISCLKLLPTRCPLLFQLFYKLSCVQEIAMFQGKLNIWTLNKYSPLNNYSSLIHISRWGNIFPAFNASVGFHCKAIIPSWNLRLPILGNYEQFLLGNSLETCQFIKHVSQNWGRTESKCSNWQCFTLIVFISNGKTTRPPSRLATTLQESYQNQSSNYTSRADNRAQCPLNSACLSRTVSKSKTKSKSESKSLLH